MLESGIAEASAKFERELEGVTKSMSEAADELSGQIAGAGGAACTCHTFQLIRAVHLHKAHRIGHV